MKITSKEAFDKLVQGIKKGQSPSPRIMVGMGTCGIAAGAGEVYQDLEAEVKKRGLDIVLTKVGCVGACHSEPSVEFSYPDGKSILLGPVTPADVHAVMDLHESGKLEGSRFVLENDYIDAFVKGGA